MRASARIGVNQYRAAATERWAAPPTCAHRGQNPVGTITNIVYHTTNVKNMHLHRDSNPGPWNTVPML